MVKIFTPKILCLLFFIACCGIGRVFAQQQRSPDSKNDTVKVQIPLNAPDTRNARLLQGLFDTDPPNLVRTVEYDAISNRYILYERVGNLLYRPPQYLTFTEYLLLKERENERTNFKQISDSYAYASQQPGFIPQIKIRSQTFAQIFGGNTIDIRPQGFCRSYPGRAG